MACYHPIKAWYSNEGKLVFRPPANRAASDIKIPCGQCIGCRLEYSRQWAMRIMHEKQMHEDAYFLTLTYSDEHVPKNGDLVKGHLQKFYKDYRQYLTRKLGGKKIRYYSCGEYGEQTLRPHWHACIFGHDFTDKVMYKESEDGFPLYTSDTLSTIWPYGFSVIGDLSFESAAYVARYVCKKVKFDIQNPGRYFDTYNRVDPETGEYHIVSPEKAYMSRRPGIGKRWLDKFESDCYPSDTVIFRGQKMQPPKYYDNHHKDIDDIKKKRRDKARTYDKNNIPERLKVRERVKEAQFTQLKRGH